MTSTPESFYVWVDSSAPNPSGEQNRPEDFTVANQHNDQLKGKWEVAVAEIEYPNSWCNLERDGKLALRYYFPTVRMRTFQEYNRYPFMQRCYNVNQQTEKIVHPGEPIETFTIRAGNYTIESLVDAFNHSSKYITGIFNQAINRVFFVVWSHPAPTGRPALEIIGDGGRELIRVLGIQERSPDERNFLIDIPIQTEYDPQLEFKHPDFYLYGNFIEPQYVGNELKPILQLVPVLTRPKSKHQTHKEYRNRTYLNVSVGYINTLSFKLCADNGELIKFQSGYVRVYLHFRRKQ